MNQALLPDACRPLIAGIIQPYSYRFMPKVIIFRTAYGYEMQVEGVSSRIRVRRLK